MGSAGSISSKNDTVVINASSSRPHKKKTKKELDADLQQWLSDNSLSQYQKKLRSKKVNVDGLTEYTPTQIRKLCGKLKMDDATSNRFKAAVTQLQIDALHKTEKGASNDDFVVVDAPKKNDEPTLATAVATEEIESKQQMLSLLGSDSGLGLPSPKPSPSPAPNHPQHTILGLMTESQQRLQPPQPELQQPPTDEEGSNLIASASIPQSQPQSKPPPPNSKSVPIGGSGSVSVSEDMKLAIAMSLREYEHKTSDVPTGAAPMEKQPSYINRDSLLARQLFAEEKLDSWRELPTRVLTQHDAALLQAVEKSCVICMGEFEMGETLRRLGVCGCEYHLECIDEYFEQLETDKIVLQCPIDRSAPLSSDAVTD